MRDMHVSSWGHGTRFYGKWGKDKATGEFNTTKWRVLFHLPIVPQGSYRVKVVSEGAFNASYTNVRQMPMVPWRIVMRYLVVTVPIITLYLIFVISTPSRQR